MLSFYLDQPLIRSGTHKEVPRSFICMMSSKMLVDSQYIQLEGLSDSSEMSLRLSLLSGRNSRRVSDNSLTQNSLQRSIDETVERNPCKRMGLHQVRRQNNT